MVEQIQWDPHKSLLASCSNDDFICIWSPEKNTPELTLDKPGSSVLTIKWSHGRVGGPTGEEALLAAGCSNGQILIFNVKAGNLLTRLESHDRE